MLLGMPAIGVRFDLNRVASGNPELACWKIFWRAIDPESLVDANLYEGSSAATLAGEENVCCLAIQGANSGIIDRVRTALAASGEFKAVCASPMFVEGQLCVRERLPDAGKVDAYGDIIGRGRACHLALAAVQEERQGGATPEPGAAASGPPRQKPASERTRLLPKLGSFEDLRKLLATFTPRQFPREGGVMYWVTPEELCDIVEAYAGLMVVELREYACAASQEMCTVSLFEKHPPGTWPIEFNGLFPFASSADARRIGAAWRTAPEYANILPKLAGIRGKYQINFCKGEEISRSEMLPAERRTPPALLWSRIWERLERVQAAVRQEAEERERRQTEEEAKRQAEDAERTKLESQRRSLQQCVVCGLGLSVLDRMRGRDRHGACEASR
jgi:hypothetical protein